MNSSNLSKSCSFPSAIIEVPLENTLMLNISEKYFKFSSLFPTTLKKASLGISISNFKIFNYLRLLFSG